jgi:hypothetical protein
MNWILAGLAVLLLLVLFLTSTGSSTCCKTRSLSPSDIVEIQGKDLLLPSNQYYSWMLIDAELSTNPLLDICYPFQSFRTLEEGAIQVVDKYSYDLGRPIGSKQEAEVNGSHIIVTPYLLEMVTEALDKPIDIVRFKSVSSETVLLTVVANEELHDFFLTFQQLSDTLSHPRLAVKNVGYFSNQVVYKNHTVDIIQRYTRPVIRWRVMPEIPISWHMSIQRSFTYWNKHFEAIGGPLLDLDLTPWTGSIADPSVNLFCLAFSSGYIGVGTTCSDHRSGEHLWSRIAIDPLSVESQVSLFPGGRDHQDQLIQYAIIHELGHTLGLRHNFVAQVDGNSSYMAYFPSWYPNADGGLRFLTSDISGVYDALAIEYGYRTVDGETLDIVPPQLQTRIDTQQCLFHTDENVDRDKILAQAHRHAMAESVRASRDWMKAWEMYRPKLFKNSTQHLLDVRRTFFFLNSIGTAVTNSMTFVRGYNTDYNRETLVLDDRTNKVLGDAVEFLIGKSWRLQDLENNLTSVVLDEEGSLVTASRPYKGRYTIDQAPIAELHLNAVMRISRTIFVPKRLLSNPNPGKLLLQLLTTPASVCKKSVVGGGSDLLHLNTITGVLSTIEYYKERYPPGTQASLEAAMQSITTGMSEHNKEHIATTVMRTTSAIKARRIKEKPSGGCGNH